MNPLVSNPLPIPPSPPGMHLIGFHLVVTFPNTDQKDVYYTDYERLCSNWDDSITYAKLFESNAKSYSGILDYYQGVMKELSDGVVGHWTDDLPITDITKAVLKIFPVYTAIVPTIVGYLEGKPS